MQNNDLNLKRKSPCSTSTSAVPECITCIKCGHEIEIWTDEDETACRSCGYKVFKKETLIH